MGKQSTLLSKLANRHVLVLAALVCALATAAVVIALYPKNATAAMNRGYYTAARGYYLDAAEKGDAKAQNAIGNLYYLGLGGEKNYRIAADWYLKSAAQAHAPAQVNLARHFTQGLGVRKDAIRAYGWLRQARINHSEIAENRMRWIAGSLSLAPGQIQLAQKLYAKLSDLLPSKKDP